MDLNVEKTFCPGSQLPSSSKWGQQSANHNHTQNALSLAEIQKLEEERERQACEEVRPTMMLHSTSFFCNSLHF